MNHKEAKALSDKYTELTGRLVMPVSDQERKGVSYFELLKANVEQLLKNRKGI